MEEVQQGQCVPRGQQGGGSQGEEGVDEDSDKRNDPYIYFSQQSHNKLTWLVIFYYFFTKRNEKKK
jgi:hypothetical protein